MYHDLTGPLGSRASPLTNAPSGHTTGLMTNVHSFSARTIDGTERSLADYAGKVLLIVNVASKCGLTPQYTALEKLYKEHHAAGLEVLGFPCNQFGGQEPGTEAEIQRFCTIQYDVTFPLFAKIDVNGASTHPLYAHLKSLDTKPEGKGDVSWNFAKFLVDRRGEVIARFKPPEDPAGKTIRDAIDRALAG